MGICQARATYTKTISTISDGLIPHVRSMIKQGHEVRLVFDNFDFKVLANIMLRNHQNSDYHWIAQFLTFDRVSTRELDNTKPLLDDLNKLENINYLLSKEELESMYKEMVIIVARVLVELFDGLSCLKSITDTHITHKHSKEMAQTSKIIGLPVVPFNQAKHSGVCQYLDWLQEFLLSVYAPDTVSVDSMSSSDKLKLMEELFEGIII